jgi:hypothetical protein
MLDLSEFKQHIDQLAEQQAAQLYSGGSNSMLLHFLLDGSTENLRILDAKWYKLFRI